MLFRPVYQLLQAVPTTQLQIDTLNDLRDNNPEIDFWTAVKLFHGVDIAVSPTDVERVIDILKMSNISYDILIENLQRSMDEEQASMTTGNENQVPMMLPSWWCRFWGIGCETTGTGSGGSGGSGGTGSGGNTDVVGLFARHNDIGKNMNNGQTNKPIIFIEAGIHAREWIAPAVAVYIIDMVNLIVSLIHLSLIFNCLVDSVVVDI
ncbi:hypothetical protein KUTeg_010827 [Tegillarca granosa]|uniref:Uncharacterized protein n=1 Tax=Tegillarca granosa TaxID=220873 RepID=A0ABQ9F6G4_TEGGR|nr:hypothetical protein KUTeg_010827 [Tegillarca granosa]